MIPSALTGAALTGLLFAERSHSRYRLPTKTVASLGFVWLALSDGLPTEAYGWWIVAGLTLSLIGDVALVWESGFIVGLVSFALAHVAYAIAFVSVGIDLVLFAAALAITAVAFRVVHGWLMGRVPNQLRIPVLAYMTIISLMLATASGTGNVTIVIGAALFYLSDLGVARQRFVAPDFRNKLIGLPLYYAAQLVLATTILN